MVPTGANEPTTPWDLPEPVYERTYDTLETLPKLKKLRFIPSLLGKNEALEWEEPPPVVLILFLAASAEVGRRRNKAIRNRKRILSFTLYIVSILLSLVNFSDLCFTEYMNKKFLIVGAILVLLGVGGGGYYLYSNQKKLESLDPLPGTVPTPDIFTKEYKDENVGFSFKYPEGWSLNTHPEDKVNYAQVELARDGGKIIIWAKDPPAGTLDDFIKKDKELGGGLVIDTNWGGVSAKKISTKGDKAKIVTVTIYDDLLFLAEVYTTEKGKEFEVYDGVLANFKFQTIPGMEKIETKTDSGKTETGGSEGGSENVETESDEAVYMEEEVVE